MNIKLQNNDLYLKFLSSQEVQMLKEHLPFGIEVEKHEGSFSDSYFITSADVSNVSYEDAEMIYQMYLSFENTFHWAEAFLCRQVSEFLYKYLENLSLEITDGQYIYRGGAFGLTQDPHGKVHHHASDYGIVPGYKGAKTVKEVCDILLHEVNSRAKELNPI